MGQAGGRNADVAFTGVLMAADHDYRPPRFA
jgi:hypothetical protein